MRGRIRGKAELNGLAQPDLLLMDIVLQGTADGVETVQEIRTRIDLPVVYLTAHTDQETVRRAKLTQPFGFLLKPFDERELQFTIEMALFKSEADRSLRENRHWLSTTLQSIDDAVVTTDTEGRIQLFNHVAERVTGWKAKSVPNANDNITTKYWEWK